MFSNASHQRTHTCQTVSDTVSSAHLITCLRWYPTGLFILKMYFLFYSEPVFKMLLVSLHNLMTYSCPVCTLARHCGPGERPFLLCSPCSPFCFHHHSTHSRDGHTHFPASKTSGSPRQTPCRKPLPLSVTVKFLKKEKSGSVIWSETN